MTADQNGWNDPSEEEREGLEAWEQSDENEAWRGAAHPEGWPELLAGPEYWLYRRDSEQ